MASKAPRSRITIEDEDDDEEELNEEVLDDIDEAPHYLGHQNYGEESENQEVDDESDDDISKTANNKTGTSKSKKSSLGDSQKAASKRARPISNDDDDEDFEDDEDDLFNSEEEEDIMESSAAKNESKQKKTFQKIDSKKKSSQSLSSPRKTEKSYSTKPKRSRLDEYDEDEDDDSDAEDDDDDEGLKRRKRRQQPQTRRQSSSSTARKSSGVWGNDKDDVDPEDEGDGEGEGEEGSNGNRASAPRRANDYENEDVSDEAELEDFLRLQLRRNFAEKWVHEPYFDDVVRGMFVRIIIGNNEIGEATYRMAEVLEAVTVKPYRLLDKSEATKALRCSIGANEKVFKLLKLSNSRITQFELTTYLNLAKDSRGYRPLTKNGVEKRRARQKTAQNHTYTYEEIREMVDKNGFLNKMKTTDFTNTLVMIEKSLSIARETKDLDRMEKLQKEKERVEREFELRKKSFQMSTEISANVNKRNKGMNVRSDMEAKVQETEASNTPAKPVIDPFIRRDTRPKILWNTGASKQPAASTGADTETTTAAASRTSTTAATPGSSTPATESQTNSSKEAGVLNVTADKNTAAKKRASDDDGLSLGKVSLEEVRMRVKARLGVDPIEWSLKDERTRYLEQACRSLPPLGSQEREEFRERRDGISLASYLIRQTSEIETEG